MPHPPLHSRPRGFLGRSKRRSFAGPENRRGFLGACKLRPLAAPESPRGFLGPCKLRKFAGPENPRRGFLGPIGDDIPSIFPIVFGVLIFTGTMMYAFNGLAEKNNYLEIRKAALGLGGIVMQKGYLSDDAFNSACLSDYQVYARRSVVKALVTVKKFCPTSMGGAGPIDLSSDVFTVGPPLPYAQHGRSCSSEGKPDNYYLVDPRTGKRPSDFPTDFVILNYPVAVDCTNEPGNIKGVGMVNVIVWRK